MALDGTATIAITLAAIALATVALDGGPAAGQSAEPRPSFECKRATTVIEKAICEDEFLSFRDGALGRLYFMLVKRLSGAARAGFQRAQLDWIAARDRACGAPAMKDRASCLLQQYDARLAALNRAMTAARLGPASRGLQTVAGAYGKKLKNFHGGLLVVEMPDRGVWIEINTVNGPTAHLCMVRTNAAWRIGATVAWRSTEWPKCRVSIAFSGTAARIEATDGCRTFCGARGAFSGITYERAR